jgi:hypothetical protein
MDGFGAYFGDNTLDTISYAYVPLIYINPQIQNPSNNIIKDTLNWTAITGTFIATGVEKFMLIGNFKSDAATNKQLIDPTNTNPIGTDVCIDDVSCIPIDLPAFAGHDTTCIPGTTIYLGRPRDVGIDEACMWYKWPNMSTAIDTAAGIYVSPVATTTYIVRQEICGYVKWDTVVVYKNGVGLDELEMLNNKLKISPNPASDNLELKYSPLPEALEGEAMKATIYNNLGQAIKEDELQFKDGKAMLNTSELKNGVYVLKLTLPSSASGTVSRRFVISR